MVTTVRSLGLSGIAGYEVTAECFLSGGLPAFDIVGLPDAAVREARERVRAAEQKRRVRSTICRFLWVCWPPRVSCPSPPRTPRSSVS